MQLFKIMFSLFAIGSAGGATYAVFWLKKMPRSVAFSFFLASLASVMAASASLIPQLAILPQAIDGIKVAKREATEFLERFFNSSSPTTDTKPIPSHPTQTPTPDLLPQPPISMSHTAAELAIDAAIPFPEPAQVKPLTANDIKDPSHQITVLPHADSGPLPPPSDLQIEAILHLTVHEGASYNLTDRNTYILDAPFGFTAGYRIDTGLVSLYRDGKQMQYCTEAFRTYARISRYSVKPCTPTAVLRVTFVRSGNEIEPSHSVR